MFEKNQSIYGVDLVSLNAITDAVEGALCEFLEWLSENEEVNLQGQLGVFRTKLRTHLIAKKVRTDFIKTSTQESLLNANSWDWDGCNLTFKGEYVYARAINHSISQICNVSGNCNLVQAKRASAAMQSMLVSLQALNQMSEPVIEQMLKMTNEGVYSPPPISTIPIPLK